MYAHVHYIKLQSNGTECLIYLNISRYWMENGDVNPIILTMYVIIDLIKNNKLIDQ